MLSTISSLGGREIAKIEGEVLPFEPLKELHLRGEIVAYLNSFQTSHVHFFHLEIYRETCMMLDFFYFS